MVGRFVLLAVLAARSAAWLRKREVAAFERFQASTDPVGMSEIAEMLDVQLNTVSLRRKDRVLPKPVVVISAVPIWEERTIPVWAMKEGYPRGARGARTEYK
jgi:hypothetical protein